MVELDFADVVHGERAAQGEKDHRVVGLKLVKRKDAGKEFGLGLG